MDIPPFKKDPRSNLFDPQIIIIIIIIKLLELLNKSCKIHETTLVNGNKRAKNNEHHRYKSLSFFGQVARSDGWQDF
jgi:hypothetical protein